MPLPGPPAEKEPPPPIIMFSTAKGMKSASCRRRTELSRGDGPGQGAGSPAGTHQEGAALQPDHDVRELGERGRAQADVRHVPLQLRAGRVP